MRIRNLKHLAMSLLAAAGTVTAVCAAGEMPGREKYDNLPDKARTFIGE